MKAGSATHHFLTLLTILPIIAAAACAAMPPEPMTTGPVSLADLFAHHSVELPCDQAPPCQDQIVAIEGSVDAGNIFNKQNYPSLPYEKFRLSDAQGRSIEVWTEAQDNEPIFDKLARRPRDRIVVTGRLVAVKQPIVNQCRWGLKVLIDESSQIQYR